MAPLALVTGASTGIGRATAVHLITLGFEVLAGVRNPEAAPPGTEPIRLEVTNGGGEAVAEIVGRALTARRPRTRYVVGRDAKVQALLARVLPDRAYDALIRRVLTSGGR
jgi:NAD(P)-dependent dehydrogenase (short-subunit alcohol dehydrogenase family)